MNSNRVFTIRYLFPELKIDKDIQTMEVLTFIIMKIFTVSKYWLVEFQHNNSLSEM